MSGTRFRILGPLEITGPEGRSGPEDGSGSGPGGESGSGTDAGGSSISYTPRAAKLRVVLGTLLVRANEVVSVDTLIDELWPTAPPRTATTTLQVYVSQVRKLLRSADPRHGQDALVTRSPGYVLRAVGEELDAAVFEEVSERGRRALAAGDFASASRLLRRAVGLWRGPVLSDTPHGPLLESAAVRLAEARMTALGERIQADLRLGRHHDLVGELQSLTAEHPLREDLHLHLMVALYRCSRAAEALEVYGVLRRTLVNELGIEPGPRSQRLHRRILEGDPALLHPGGEPQAPAGRAAGEGPAEGRAAMGRTAVRRAAVDRAVMGEVTGPGSAHHGGGRLPGADPSFVGRGAELAEVERMLREDPGAVRVAVTGMPGIGKTAFAVEGAHRVVEDFPDGRFFLELRPSDDRPPLTADEAVRLLHDVVRRADGTADGGPRESLAGRRMLLVLDGADSAAQVRGVLAAAPGSAALITGHRVPAGIDGLRTVVLGALTAGEARRMFDGAAEPSAVAEIVELCGGHPLALRIAAGLLGARPHWTAAALAARLRDERTRFGVLRTGDVQVRGHLLAAYASGTGAERRAFRVLGLLPPGEFAPGHAAAVLGLSEGDALDLVEDLVDAGLLEAAPGGGYRLPELLRLLAAEELSAREDAATVRAATERMCEAYAAQAEALTTTGPGPVPVPAAAVHVHPVRSVGTAHPLRPVPARLVRVAYEAGLWELTVRLAGGVEPEGGEEDAEGVCALALEAARRCGDRTAEARMLRVLGDLAWQWRRPGPAREHYERAWAVADDAGAREEAGRALVGLAELCLDTGAAPEAAELLRSAVTAMPAPEHVRGRYEACRALALVALESEGPDAARVWFGRCLDLARELRDVRLEAYALRSLRALHAPGSGGAGQPLETRPGVWRLRPRFSGASAAWASV
ncbi:AfsR/SARP family transcriptional regulator [Streptomyces spiralis]|uniref:AfsR/SARP family transcriptional regulator n=1 Tax=Streptomyces spiralis TaxID=66376 RepID=UPI0033F9AF17